MRIDEVTQGMCTDIRGDGFGLSPGVLQHWEDREKRESSKSDWEGVTIR